MMKTATLDSLRGMQKLPTHDHTIPCLVLCAAALGIDIPELIKEQMDFEQTDFWFYSDSQISFGYITNDVRRFNECRKSCQSY